eukprot:4524809-Alexandrium_andersonii.AAC.1
MAVGQGHAPWPNWGAEPASDRPLEHAAGYRTWSDSYQRVDYEARPQGYRLLKHRSRTFPLGRRLPQ